MSAVVLNSDAHVCRDAAAKAMQSSYKLAISARSRELAAGRTGGGEYKHHGERMYVEGVLELRRKEHLVRAQAAILGSLAVLPAGHKLALPVTLNPNYSDTPACVTPNWCAYRLPLQSCMCSARGWEAVVLRLSSWACANFHLQWKFAGVPILLQ